MTTFRMHDAATLQQTLRVHRVEAARARSCLNCAVTLVGDFCHHCGQAARTPPRVTFLQIVREIPRAAWDFDRALPHTILSLLLRPGSIIRDYLGGRRARIYSPLALLFLLSGFLGFVTSALQLHHVDLASRSATHESLALGDKLLTFYAWVIMLCVPLQAIGPTLLLRRRLRYGYGEQLMVAAMAAAGSAVLGLLFAPLEWLANAHHFSGPVSLVTSLTKLVYLAWLYAQLQDDGTRESAAWRWLRSIASVLASVVSLVLAICVVAAGVAAAGAGYAWMKVHLT